MNLFSELRRRNVIRVAIGYLAASWLLIQIVETLFPIYGLSDGAIRSVVTILAIGFVPALLASWAFEWTPEGLKKDSDVDRSAGDAATGSKTFDRIVIVVLVLALGFFAVDKFVLDPARDAQREVALAEQIRTEVRVGAFGDRSIAVLPFVNMSSDPEQDYFSDGITEELLNLLTRIPQLRVISRSSSFIYRDANIDVPSIAEKLNVAHILEGSVRKSGNRVRITVQLIEAQTDTHLWSATFDRELDDIFAIQDEIAAEVVSKLQLHLPAAVPTVDKTDAETYALYLQARLITHNRIVDRYDKAQSLLEEAVRRDPNYINAWAELGRAYLLDRAGAEGGSAERRQRFLDVLARMVEIDPDHSQTQNSLAWVAYRFDDDLVSAAFHMAKAIAANPADLNVLRVAGLMASSLARLDLAIDIAEYIIARDPACAACYANLIGDYRNTGQLDAATNVRTRADSAGTVGAATIWQHGLTLLMVGNPKEALVQFNQIKTNSPGPQMRLHGSAMALHDLGRFKESNEALNEYLQISSSVGMRAAEIYAWIGDADTAFDILFSGKPRRNNFDSALLRNLHGDSRWELLLDKMGQRKDELDAIVFEITLP